MAIEPRDAEYPHVPTPKELELSQQLVELQNEKDKREQKLLDQIADLEAQVHTLHVRIHDVSQSLQATKREHTHQQQAAIEAERAVWRTKVEALERELDQEKHDKEAQAKWQRKFVATSQTDTTSAVDATDDVFAKFAQSIALLPASSAVTVAQAGALPFLAHLLSANPSDVVSGSVLLALVHLAIHEKPQRPPLHRRTLFVSASVATLESSQNTETVTNVKDAIVKAGAAAPLVYVLEHATNLRVAAEAARLCAALASHIPNKRVLAAKHAVRFLTYRLTPRRAAAIVCETDSTESSARRSSDSIDQTEPVDALPLPGDFETQRAALSALVNLSYDSEILRSQIVNFDFLPLAVRYLSESSDVFVQCEAAKLIGNLVYNHTVNQSAAMTSGADVALTACLRAETLLESHDLVRASAIGIANLAHASVNQLAIGYGDATTRLLQLAVDATSPSVLEAVLAALTCLCHQNVLNKSRVAAQNGLHVLLYVITETKRFGHDERVLVAASECFAVVACTRANRRLVLELDGHVPVCRLCKSATSAALLEASASAVCALVPHPDERAAMLADNHESKLETRGVGLVALERARHLLAQAATGSETSSVVPSWLAAGIKSLTDYAELSISNSSSANGTIDTTDDDAPSEFHDRSYFSLESFTAIAPDELCPHFYGNES